MNLMIQKRVLEEADYMIDTKKTIRELAQIFNISKSTIHKDLHDRLLEIDFEKYKKIEKIMNDHIKIRHINGGEATKKKYLKLKKHL